MKIRNLAVLKYYPNQGYRLQIMLIPTLDEGVILPRGIGKNDEKLDCNLTRAKNTVYDLAMSNPWTNFVTVTGDPKKRDMSDLSGYHKAFTQFMRDERKRTNSKYSYLLVPEPHKSGAWHEHGLANGLEPGVHLRPFTLDEKLPKHIREKLAAGRPVYDWPGYRERFGWVDVEPIQDHKRVSAYLMKYVTKEVISSVKKLGQHSFYASKGLIRPETIKKGPASCDLVDPDYENGLCKGKWFSSPDEALKYIGEMPGASSETIIHTPDV